MTFIAKYPGTCAACDEPFGEGDYIVRYGDGYAHDVCPDIVRYGDGYAHDVCPDIPEARRDVCPVCFTERAANGRCMCHV